MISNNKLIETVNQNRINYSSVLINKDNFIKPIDSDIQVIIHTDGNKKLLTKNLLYTKHSIFCSQSRIGITVVEHNTRPTCRLESIESNCSYIFIQKKNFSNLNQESGLSFNVGALASPFVKSFLFLKQNVLLPHDFFIVGKNYFNKLNWFQNFHGKRPSCFTQKSNKEIMLYSGLKNLYLMPLQQNKNLNSIGLSISVEKKVFFEVGGFDVELRLGRPLEDMFMWVKLLSYEKQFSMITNPHEFEKEINYIYPNNPPLFSFVIEYDKFNENRTNNAQNLYNLFCGSSELEKENYMRIKKNILEVATPRKHINIL